MSRKLIIDGNAVYEIDEQCMLRRKLEENAEATKGSSENKKGTANKDMKKAEKLANPLTFLKKRNKLT